MNKLFTKIVGTCLGLAMAVGVGVAVASNKDAVSVKADTTYVWQKMTATSEFVDGAILLITQGDYYLDASQAATSNTPRLASLTLSSSLPTLTADNTCTLTVSGSGSSIKLVKSTDSSKYLYTNTSNNAARIGNSSENGQYWTISSAGTNKFYLASNASTTRYLSRYGTTDFRSYTNTNTNADLTIYKLVEYVPSSDPDFTLDKDSVSLTLGGSSTTVTATPNEYVDGGAEYSWSRTSGDDCVTLTNVDTATVTIAPKGTAVYASCTLTIAVTGCTSKTVSVSVKKVSSQSSPFTIAEVKEVVDDGTSEEKTGVYVHGYISQVDSYSSNTITYWISDDGTTTDQFEVYKGKGLNNANFNAIGDLAVGYEVTVYGNVTLYNSSVYEFSSGNYIVSLVMPDSHGVSTTTDGLTLDKDTIGSAGGTVTMTTAAKKKGTSVVVGGTATSSVSGNIVTLSDVETDITINATIVDATVTSIALTGQTTKFALDGNFEFDGTVTGTYDDWVSPHTSEEIATGYTVDDSDVDMTTEGTYTVTVTYGTASTSYEVRVAELFDNTKGEYHKVTDLSQLYDGAHVAIVDAGEEYSMLSGFTSTSNVTATSVTADATTSTISKTNVLDIELVKTGTNEYRFKLDDDLYLYAASSTSNHLKASTLATSGDNGKFLIALADETFTVTAQGTYTRNTMRFNPNNGSPLFACYASSSTTGSTVAFYVFQTYTAEANAYAETFIKGNGSANTCAATVSNWSTLGTAFGKLTTGAKNIFKEATHNASETYTTPNEYTVEHAVARYDDALQKHTDLRSNEFMGRVAAGTLVYSSARIVNPLINSDSSSAVSVIVIISLAGLTAIGGCFFIRRRKENN